MQGYERFVTIAQSREHQPCERHEAFAQLVAQFHGMALTYAQRLLGDEQAAQDAAQEAFLTAHQRLAQLREPAAFPGWLQRIVHSQCHRQIRTRRPAQLPISMLIEGLAVEEDMAQAVADAEATQLVVDAIMAAVAALPDHEQSVVRLFYLEGYSIREAAAALDVPVTTIKKRLQYARERLRDDLLERFKIGGSTQGWTIQSLGLQISQWLLPLFSVLAAEPVLCPAYVTIERRLR